MLLDTSWRGHADNAQRGWRLARARSRSRCDATMREPGAAGAASGGRCAPLAGEMTCWLLCWLPLPVQVDGARPFCDDKTQLLQTKTRHHIMALPSIAVPSSQETSSVLEQLGTYIVEWGSSQQFSTAHPYYTLSILHKYYIKLYLLILDKDSLDIGSLKAD